MGLAFNIRPPAFDARMEELFSANCVDDNSIVGPDCLREDTRNCVLAVEPRLGCRAKKPCARGGILEHASRASVHIARRVNTKIPALSSRSHLFLHLKMQPAAANSHVWTLLKKLFHSIGQSARTGASTVTESGHESLRALHRAHAQPLCGKRSTFWSARSRVGAGQEMTKKQVIPHRCHENNMPMSEDEVGET